MSRRYCRRGGRPGYPAQVLALPASSQPAWSFRKKRETSWVLPQAFFLMSSLKQNVAASSMRERTEIGIDDALLSAADFFITKAAFRRSALASLFIIR